MMNLFLFLIVAFAVMSRSFATNTTGGLQGIDFKGLFTPDMAKCFSQGGVSFFISSGYYKGVDTNVCPSLTNAKNANIPNRDVYMMPVAYGYSKRASEQIDEVVNYLKGNCQSDWSGRVWINVQTIPPPNYVGNDVTKNRAFYQELVDTCISKGYICGVFAVPGLWDDIFGSTTFSYGVGWLPLWYQDTNNQANFNYYVPFGGYATPYVHQYYNTNKACSQSWDYGVTFYNNYAATYAF